MNEPGNLQAAVEGQFFHDVMHMTFDSMRGYVQLKGNIFIAHAVCNENYDLAFAFCHADRVPFVPLPLF